MKSKNLSENILKAIKSSGYKYIDLDAVIDTNIILERSGETFKRFIFTFNDQLGNELCLRPDLTIASCVRYLNQNKKNSEKIFYSGQAFRKGVNKKDPVIRNQIGFEILGSFTEKKDDKKIIQTSLKTLSKVSYKSGEMVLGNIEIFRLLLDKLDCPARWKLRLQRHFWREKYFNDLLKRLETNSDIDPTIVEIDKKKYYRMIKGNKKKQVAGRSVEEILLRFDSKIKDPRRTKKGSNVVKILKEYLKIECPINQASKKLNSFFKKYKINLRVQDDYFPITINKINKLNVRFSSSFGRHLEYYTGLVFKIDIKSNSQKLNIRGGRYDSLIKDLGFKKNIPAVGAAINLKKI